MGCDIHVRIEVRKKEETDWKELTFKNNIDDGGIEILNYRNYDVFAHLVGVTNFNNVVPALEINGIPDDVSESVKNNYEHWKDYAYSAAHFYDKQIYEIVRKSDGILSPFIIEINKYIYSLNNPLDYQWRVIFWFD